jgi:hypothetical protein
LVERRAALPDFDLFGTFSGHIAGAAALIDEQVPEEGRSIRIFEKIMAVIDSGLEELAGMLREFGDGETSSVDFGTKAEGKGPEFMGQRLASQGPDTVLGNGNKADHPGTESEVFVGTEEVAAI